jgi:hypothetical protein
MEVGELLDEAFDLYKKNFRLFFGIAVLVNVPVSLLVLVFPYGSLAMWAVRIASVCVSFITMSALTDAALSRLLTRETTIAASYRHGLRRLFWVLAGMTIYAVAAGIGLILFVFPGMVVSLWWLLLIPVIMVENRGWFGLLKRPRQLAAGNLWRLFFLALGLGLLALIVSGVLGALVVLIATTGGIDLQHPPDLSSGTGVLIWAGYLFVSALANSAWAPAVTTAQLLAYLDLRIRREAYDIELLTQAVEERVQAAKDPASLITPLPGQAGG